MTGRKARDFRPRFLRAGNQLVNIDHIIGIRANAGQTQVFLSDSTIIDIAKDPADVMDFLDKANLVINP